MGVPTPAQPEDLDMPDATVGERSDAFARPDLSTFCRLDELGLVVAGQRLEPDRAILACRVLEPDQWCRRRTCQGSPRDTVLRRLTHEPLGWRPTVLEIRVCRYRCAECGHVWRQDTTRAAEPRAKLSRRGLRWALGKRAGQIVGRATLYLALVGPAFSAMNYPGERIRTWAEMYSA